MLVKNWMSKPVITINANDSMNDAVELLKEHKIRKLAVIDSRGKLAGLITDGDIKKSSASAATSLEIHELMYIVARIKVKDIMTKSVITVGQNQTIDEAAQILLKNKISCLPIIDENKKLVGILSEIDIFKALISFTGIDKKGIHFGFMLVDKSGSIQKMTDILRKYCDSLTSILTSYSNVPENYRKVYIRIQGVERDKLEELKKELNDNLEENSKLLYIIDYKKGASEIF